MLLIFFQSIVFIVQWVRYMSQRNSIEKEKKKTFVLKSESIQNKFYVEFSIVFSLFVLCTKTNDESIDA